jgi:hypothetical protein
MKLVQSSDKLVICVAEQPWVSTFMSRYRDSSSDVATFAVVFQSSGGPIGFDLSPIGGDIFRKIIGEAITWDEKTNSLVAVGPEGPFRFIKKSIGWLPQPITVVMLPGDTDAMSRGNLASRLQQLMKSDADNAGFGDLLADFFNDVERLCVHSVGQWQTIVVTRGAQRLLEETKAICEKEGIAFSFVGSESALPAW